MADGYRNNGLFKIDPDLEKARDRGIINPPFLYPPKTVRFLDAQDSLNGVAAGEFKSYELQRGYLRNLAQPMMGETPINKCNFQFNPQDIRQSVQMREDMYLAVLQDPVQLSQPIGAQMNFQFDLLFDRQMEVARGLGGAGVSEEVADQIGVMRDLKVLYAAIGQGLSEGMVESQLKALQDGATRVYGNNNPATTPDNGDDAETPVAPTFSAFDDLGTQNGTDFLNMNTGNAAFLMPNPVRLMFASLFMLDGFVTATNVEFLKFSTKMVPVTCKVSISMMSVYIGFARKDTFLTTQFQSAADAEDEARQADEAGSRELLEALNITGKSVTWGFNWEFNRGTADDGTLSGQTDVDNFEVFPVNPNNINNGNPLTVGRAVKTKPSKYVNTDANDPEELNENFVFRFDKVKPKRGSGRDTDEILRLYEEDAQFTVSYNWSCRIYGDPTRNSTNGGWLNATDPNLIVIAATEEQSWINKRFSDSVSRALDDNNDCVLLGLYQGSKEASSKSEWGAGTSGDNHGDSNARRLLIRGKRGKVAELTNGAASARQNANGSGYYIVVWQLEMTGLVAGLRPHSRPAPEQQCIVQIKNSSDRLYINYNDLDWTAGGS